LGAIRDEAAGQIPLTFCIGEVLEVTAATLKVRANGLELDQDDILVNHFLQYDFQEEGDFTITGSEGAATFGGYASCGLAAHTVFEISSYSGELKFYGRYHVKSRLAAGDKVLLIPSADGQTYYLAMKVVQYGAVSTD
jgi:hypothetical protein